ncbi:MAG: hypothetical protein KDD01_10820 [Phaeodactylibacter sp.]|nr:hypothetical protein [Phaeodactylibacter sp.]
MPLIQPYEDLLQLLRGTDNVVPNFFAGLIDLFHLGGEGPTSGAIPPSSSILARWSIFPISEYAHPHIFVYLCRPIIKQKICGF